MARKCVGLIEAIGLASAIQAADAAVKSGNVALIGYEYSGYDAHIVVKVEGNVGAVKAVLFSAKLRISEKNTKEKSIFLCFLERKYFI